MQQLKQSLASQDTPTSEPTPLQSFLTVNRDRIRRMRAGMPSRQAQFLDVLPLLLHSNHPGLPGFITNTAPAGIADYQPAPHTIKAVQKLFRAYTPQPKAIRQKDILGVYFMGSCGTIAHSEESDYDVWLCHGPWLNETQLDLLRQKAHAIEAWASTNGVEVHFFIFDSAQFKNGSYQQLSSESSGSTQHYLLLDEFYRSSLVIAGLVPIWFEIPPEQERDYDSAVTTLVQKPGAQRQLYVDFGGVGHVPAEEFFGATLWQLYKSINSPFKSVLKLLLMEVYAADFPDIEMLSLQYKRALYAGETGLDQLDPYLLMYRRIEQLLLQTQDLARLDVLRKCFYLKISEPLSRPAKPGTEASWRRRALQELVTAWQWEPQKCASLDRKNHWQIGTVIQERRELVAAITQCYRMLSKFARTHAELSRISQADLLVLGRKLYTAFERKAGKIELINRGIVESLHVAEAGFRYTETASEPARWSVLPDYSKGLGTPDEASVKHASNVFELLCWAYFNKIIDRDTQLNLQAPRDTVTQREVNTILATLVRLYPDAQTFHPDTQVLVSAPRLLNVTLFVNIGRDPLPEISNDGLHLASARTNTLSYGADRHNLVHTVDVLLETSWGELFTHHYVGSSGLFDCIKEYLRWAPPAKQNLPPVPQIHCFSSAYGTIIKSGLVRLFQGIVHAFYGKRIDAAARYVVDVGNRHLLLSCNSAEITHLECANFSALLKQLGAPTPQRIHTTIDEQSMRTSLLPLLYGRQQIGAIDFFLQASDKHAEVYILDEDGSLHIQVLPHYDKRLLLQQYMLFFAAINRRRFFLAPNGGAPFREPQVNFYAITKDQKGQRALQEIRYNFDSLSRLYFNIQVMVSSASNGDRSFTIYCNDHEFSSLRYGNKMFQAVARHVLAMRDSGQTYPMYITDIDLAPDLIGEQGKNPLQTIYFLTYKKNIEDRLNEAMKHIEV